MGDPTGFSDEILPLHVLNGTGNLQGMIRNPPLLRPSTKQLAAGAQSDRTILCEYHAVGSVTGLFMVRRANCKFVHFVGQRPQLFDLQTDPEQRCDLALEAGHDAILAEGERRLRAICDPETVNARAFADQASLMEEFGGGRPALRRPQ